MNLQSKEPLFIFLHLNLVLNYNGANPLPTKKKKLEKVRGLRSNSLKMLVLNFRVTELIVTCKFCLAEEDWFNSSFLCLWLYVALNFLIIPLGKNFSVIYFFKYFLLMIIVFAYSIAYVGCFSIGLSLLKLI